MSAASTDVVSALVTDESPVAISRLVVTDGTSDVSLTCAEDGGVISIRVSVLGVDSMDCVKASEALPTRGYLLSVSLEAEQKCTYESWLRVVGQQSTAHDLLCLSLRTTTEADVFVRPAGCLG